LAGREGFFFEIFPRENLEPAAGAGKNYLALGGEDSDALAPAGVGLTLRQGAELWRSLSVCVDAFLIKHQRRHQGKSDQKQSRNYQITQVTTQKFSHGFLLESVDVLVSFFVRV